MAAINRELYTYACGLGVTPSGSNPDLVYFFTSELKKFFFIYLHIYSNYSNYSNYLTYNKITNSKIKGKTLYLTIY